MRAAGCPTALTNQGLASRLRLKVAGRHYGKDSSEYLSQDFLKPCKEQAYLASSVNQPKGASFAAGWTVIARVQPGLTASCHVL